MLKRSENFYTLNRKEWKGRKLSYLLPYSFFYSHIGVSMFRLYCFFYWLRLFRCFFSQKIGLSGLLPGWGCLVMWQEFKKKFIEWSKNVGTVIKICKTCKITTEKNMKCSHWGVGRLNIGVFIRNLFVQFYDLKSLSVLISLGLLPCCLITTHLPRDILKWIFVFLLHLYHFVL